MKKFQQCPLCRSRVKDWQGEDPRCAFAGGVFSPDNWRCATLDALCALVEDRATWSQDHALLVLAVPEQVVASEHAHQPTHVVLQRYKHRGCVQQATVLDMVGRQHPLTVELASALAALGRA